MSVVVEINNLIKDYGNFRAVDGLNLSIAKGEVFGFLGPNGAGKSTTIRMMLTLIAPTSGSIKFFGEDLLKNRKSLLAKIGSIVEKPDFYKFLSARKNLELLSTVSGGNITKNKIDEVIELVGLKGREQDKVGAYSFGMKQRLGIAHALLNDPELIILDEPTTGLDPHGIIDIRNLITHLAKDKGITIFLSSHILSEIEMIASSMAIINKGKTVAQGNVKELMDAEKSILRFTTDNALLCKDIINNKFKTESVIVNDAILEFGGKSSEIPLLIRTFTEQGINIYEVNKRTKLEDLFLRLTEN